ncbi:3-oxoacyl-[acyl-carrier-protein] reductase FabG [Leucoagaricus sp. SymC.cos]|nr:3-oxoacyl-[acyl-carrier-protein] reductase FabG [Leucoagaricus sp. SymC.cos]
MYAQLHTDNVHHALQPGRVAVITGAAHGIGEAAAKELARLGLKVAITDINEELLYNVGRELMGMVGEQNVLVVPTDVSRLESVQRLRDKIYETWGEVGVLMNNAGVRFKATAWDGTENWRKVFGVNVLGMINVQHTFVPSMIPQENPSIVINSGSKRGITNPPGDVVYSASKAAVKSFTESLAHELRELPNNNISVHLFAAGNTWTGLTGDDGTGGIKPDAAWTPEQTVLYMLDKVRQGDFYILVPDNETPREVDQLRIMWSAGDVVEGRPPLSRWHKDYQSLFEKFMREGLAALSA